MKKFFFLAAAVSAAVSINATELFSGSQAVSWSSPLNIEASQFSDAQAGQKLVVSYTDAKDGIEFKIPDVWDHLAGSREAAWIGGEGQWEQFLSAKAVEQIKANGLQIVGNDFTCTKVELEDGKSLKEGITVWTGFFWADEWSTLELYKEGYNTVDFSSVVAVRFYTEASGKDYVLNFLEGWGEGEKFADQSTMTNGEGYKELTLTDELRTRLANAGHWMVQFNKESLSAFNVTDIVLVLKGEQTGIEQVQRAGACTKVIEDGRVVIIRGDKRYGVLGY